MHGTRPGQRLGDMGHDGPGIHLTRFQRADDGTHLLQRLVAQLDPLGLGDLGPDVVEGRSCLRHRPAFTAQLGGRIDARLHGRVRDEDLLAVDPLFLLQRAADHLDRPLVGQRHEAARNRGHRIVNVTRGNRHRHGLCRLEEAQFHVKARIGEIAALEGDETARVAGEAQRAHGDLAVRGDGRGGKAHGGRGAHGGQHGAAVEMWHGILPI